MRDFDRRLNEREERIAHITLGPKIDFDAYCKCSHKRREHHNVMGCMNWDEESESCWCSCNGFVNRSSKYYTNL